MSMRPQAGLVPVNAAGASIDAIAFPETYTKGLAMAGAAMFLYAFMDACAKGLAGHIDPAQILLVRCIFAFALGVAMTIARRATLSEVLRTRQPGLQVARGLCAVVSMYCAILAVGMMSLAEALTIIYAAPIAATLLAIPLLNEHVGLRRFSAVAAGFMGVIIVAGPGTGELNSGFLLALAAMLFYALATVITRRLGRTDRGLTTHFYTQFCFLGVTLPLMPFVWVTPTFDEASLLLGAGVCGAVAVYLLTEAHQAAPPAVVAPMDYTVILWGSVLGMLVWGEVPSATTWIGIILIAATGLYIAQREIATTALNRLGPFNLWARRHRG